MPEKIKKFWKNQTVLCIAAILAIISCFLIPPSAAYIEYINADTLILLFVLMGAVAGLRICGVFQRLAGVLTKMCSNARVLALVMLTVCFFSSMFITNDVALLTFVPVTLLIYAGRKDEKSSKALIYTVIFETAAANLGSMLLPTGNPQNIYLCSYFSLTPAVLVRTLLPYGILAYVLLCLSVLLIPKLSLAIESEQTNAYPTFSWRITLCCTFIFVLALLTVSGKISATICLCASVALLLIATPRTFAMIDYFLLLTFVCFFIFTGNLGQIQAISTFLSSFIGGRELAVSIAVSQVFSNVPAAILLSGFTNQGKTLLLGVNIGGLGTPIASLASLISYQLYAKENHEKSKKYLGQFMIYAYGLLALLCLSVLILK